MLACWGCHISGVIDFIPPKFLLQAACMSCGLLFSQGTNVHTYHHKYDTTYCMSGDSLGNWMQSNRVIWSISQGWRISVWCFERLHARSVQIVELGMWGDNLMYIIVNRQWFPISYITRIHIPYSLFFRLWRNTTKPRLLVNEITASERNNSNSPRTVPRYIFIMIPSTEKSETCLLLVSGGARLVWRVIRNLGNTSSVWTRQNI